MKKNLFLCLFAALCTMGTFTACSSDDESGVITPAAADVTGNYKGNLDVMVDAANLPTVENQLVSVTKAGESTVSLSISDFSFMGISIGDINLNECQLSGSGDKYTFTGTTKVNAAILTADVDAEGTFEGDKLTINMDIAASLDSVKQTVKVVYTGTKLTSGSESSEAKILSFVFDQEVSAANAVVLEQPVVDETAKTIKFAVSADATSDDLSKLMPTIEVSEKATVTPASGAVQDFSNGKTVTYTVTAENGTKVTYTASVYGNVTSYDFENWSYDTSMYSEENQIYMANGWASCNNAVALIKYMGAWSGITYTGEYPIRPSDDAFTGEKAALLESVDTQGGNIFGQKVPKVTAASIFLGSFNAMAAISDPMATTSFGIMYDKQPLKVTGYYKYTPGTEFYNANGELQEGVTDKCAMSAVLYEVSSEDETLNGSNIYTSDKIVAKAVFTSDKSVDTYTPFELNLEYAKAYDSSKKYKFAIIFSASADGASYNAAVGSKLLIDNVSVVNQN